MDDALDMLKLSAWELHGIDVDDFTANDDPEQLFVGPGAPNLLGALRKAMALCGYESVKELQTAELVVTAGSA